MKKLLNNKIEVGKKVNEVREVVKNYNKEKRDMFDYTEKLFKPTIKAQKDIKKAIDDKQDELINQIQINDELANMKQNQVIAKLQQNNNRQNEIITNIQENQKALKKGFSDLIEPYQREIIFRDELPKMIEDKGSDKGVNLIELGDDDNKDLIDLSDASVSSPSKDIFTSPESKVQLSPKPKIMDPDKGMSDEYKIFLDKNKLPLPSEIIVGNKDPKSIVPKINQQIKKREKFIVEKSTKKGAP